MRAFELLLVLFLWFELCSAYPKKQDDSWGTDNEENSALALLREPRSITSNPISNFEAAVMGILSLPANPIQTITRLIAFVVRFIVNWLIRVPLQGPLIIAVKVFQFLSSMFPTYFAYLPKTIDAVKDYVREEVTNLLEKTLSMLWHFLSTTGLPWLRRFLDQIAKLPNVPAPVRSLIQSFNAMYNLAQLLGMVSPAY